MINSDYYNIVYTRIGVLLHPSFLRDELTIVLLRAFLSPLDDLHAQFTSLKNGIDYNNYSQVCYMQAMINDYFDPLERRIKIKNSHMDQDSYLLWKESVKKPIRFYKEGSENYRPFGWSMEGQLGTRNSDFDIVLPKGFRLSEEEENKMRNLVNQSKLASKIYRITNG